MRRFVLSLVLAVSACGSDDDQSTSQPFIDWESLRNPVLAEDDRALKDVAVAYDPATREFYVFSSVRLEAGDPGFETEERSFYRTRDWRTFEAFSDPDVNGPGYGPGSPDLSFLGGAWHMVFQAPSSFGGDARILRHSVSPDLGDWSEAAELAPELLDPALRNIDGALAEDGGYYYLGWKRVQDFHVTRSVGRSLDGRWLEALPASAGGEWAENFQFIRIDGVWRMIATGYDPGPFRCRDNPIFVIYTCNHEPFIYTMDGSGASLEDWTRWVDKRHLVVPFEDWNTIMHANSAYLADWRAYDGSFYLFYAGSSDGHRFDMRGHGKIGVVRSHDLVDWYLPGDMR